MFGGIPKTEIEAFRAYWEAFPGLKEALFESVSDEYVKTKVDNIPSVIDNYSSVATYRKMFADAFEGFYETLREDLIDGVLDVSVEQEKEKVTMDIFNRINPIKLTDRYTAYQVFAEYWDTISTDIEMLQGEGFEVITQVDPNMVVKKNKNKEDDEEVVEVQEGWKGHILPFELVQQELMPEELKAIKELEARLSEISEEYVVIIDTFEEDEKQGTFLNDTNDAFVLKELKALGEEIFQDIENDEIKALNAYLSLSKKKDKQEYIQSCKMVDWAIIAKGKDGTCTKSAVNNRIQQIRVTHDFPKESFEYKILAALKLMNEESEVKRKVKQRKEILHIRTKEVIEGLDEKTALQILEHKWILPLDKDLKDLSDRILSGMIEQITYLAQKYATTLHDIQVEKAVVRKELVNMLGKLNAQGSDMEGLQEFKRIIGGQA